MSVLANLDQAGVAIQTAKGTPNANPVFGHGVRGGAIVDVTMDQTLEDRTSSRRVSPGANRNAVVPVANFTCRAHPRSIGAYLYAVLGGKGVTGAGPYTHTFTYADLLPYLSIFGKTTSPSQISRVSDLKISELTISWNENQPVEVSINGMGCVLLMDGTMTPTNDETATALANYFIPAGGTFQASAITGTPAAAKITGGSISFKTGVNPKTISGTITPDDIDEGNLEVEVSLTLVPDNDADWQAIVTGATGGTAISASTQYGSANITFVENNGGTGSLNFNALRIPFSPSGLEANPAGGGMTLAIAGTAVQPVAGGTPITVTLINSQVSY
jgi:hypothetical protein